jgi:hypothetical protein
MSEERMSEHLPLTEPLFDLPDETCPRCGRRLTADGCPWCVKAPQPHTLARSSDPVTSKAAARGVAYRAGSQKARLLAAYAAHPEGLTDEEAAGLAGLLHTGFWKRCADLRNDGVIAPVVTPAYVLVTRAASSGEQVMVCRMTAPSS